MSVVITIIKKELVRVFKDKKLMFTLFVFPPLIIIAMYSLMENMTEFLQDDIQNHKAIIYIQGAPDSVKEIAENTDFVDDVDITYIDNFSDTDTIKQDIINEKVDLLVVFEEDFLQKFEYSDNSNIIPNIDVFYNISGNYSTLVMNNYETLILKIYEKGLLEERLGNLNVLNVFNLNNNIIVDEDKANGEVLATLLPYLITFMLIAGAMALGVDAIAGEKERGTMSSILLTPLKRWKIVLGKLLSLTILSSISAVVYAIAMIISMPMMMKSMGNASNVVRDFSLTGLQITELLIIMLCIVFFNVAIVVIISVYSKTVKEANAYIAPINIIVLLSGMATMYQTGMEKSLNLFMIPLYGNSLAIQNLMMNELTFTQFGLSISSTLIVTLILIVGIIKAFNSEKVMFNA